jgi:hypothetical protein
VNNQHDVRIVQALLNRHIAPPSRLLKVDGLVGASTKTAILAFQHRIGMRNCSGLVTPAGQTFSALQAFLHSVSLSELAVDALSNFPRMFRKAGSYLGSQGENFRGWSHQLVNILPMQYLRFAAPNAIAWGAKVSPEFKRRVIEICKELVMNADYLMTCMAFETGESFKADQANMNGGSAIGLIQFTPTAIDSLNEKYAFKPALTRQRLLEMTEVDQLHYVKLYFLPYKGKLNSMEDTYMVILAPVAVGRGPDGVVFKEDSVKHPEYYRANKGLDRSPRDGIITLKECSVVLNAKYKKGLSEGYFG